MACGAGFSGAGWQPAAESPSRHVVISVFTAKHFGAGVNLEDAIGRVAQLTANYFAARQ
jgi:hypothetical protein